jgi:hypothetical protein
VLELDHLFCFVGDPAREVQRLEGEGWELDAGQAHPGQGTRNRRLRLERHYLELLWIEDSAEARANPLRLDRRADPSTGASPLGIGLRGRPEEIRDFWPYDALGPRIWIHRDDERHPERPLVFAIEVARVPAGDLGVLRAVRVHGPAPPSLPPYAGPPVTYVPGMPLLELMVGDRTITAAPCATGR